MIEARRKRVSRCIKVDGYSILKLNNYSLEEGEQSVHAHEARSRSALVDAEHIEPIKHVASAASTSQKNSKSKKRRQSGNSFLAPRLGTYNKSMKAEREKLKRSYMAFFARFKAQLKPFVTKTVLDSFKTLTKQEITAANDAKIDVNGDPTRSQPKCIVGGTMRDYQLKSLEWLLALHEQG